MPPHILDSATWLRVSAVFDAVAELGVAERAAALDRLCVGADGRPDPGLRAEVEALLEADEGGSVLDTAAPDGAAALVASPGRAGERVGPWRVVREVGRGGMGAVDLVERADGAFEQRAALKRIAGVGADGVRRFERERQILARLEHPGIARLLDGGLDGAGAPYLVMEYVEGEPVTAWAEDHGLGLEARLRLFLQVCDAVGFAHRHLVVHRDLKPSNVLVTPDGRAVLLDFGIARLLEDDDAGERTMMPALTPEYAAPEQVTGGAVTTATDVYALGVLLYELVAGQRPYEIERPTLGGIVDTIREARPPAPSTVAGRRGLGRDLDTVVMKALAKEPGRRYASADALGADLGRVLERRPVEARAPTVGYRFRRFVARHRAGVGATAFAVLAVAASVAFYTARLAAERDRAEAAAVEAAREAARAEQTAGFLEALFEASDPNGPDPGERTARQLLDDGAARVRADLGAEPAVLAPVLATVGRVYRALGAYDAAAPALADAVGLFEATGEDPLGHRDALLELANLRYRTEDFDAAARDALGALALDSLHADTASSERLAILNTLALVYSDTERLEEAATVLREVVERRRALDTDEARGDLAVNLNNLGLVLLDLERVGEAGSLFDEAIALTEAVHGTGHPYLAIALNSRAGVHEAQGDRDAALADMVRAVAIGEAALGPDHPFTVHARGNLSDLRAGRAGRAATGG